MASAAQYDVVIIGAGLSGLRTAQDLINIHGVNKQRILILEAQDYIGGRVRQADDFVPNTPIELGAELLHGEDTLLTQFAKETNEEIRPIFCWAHGDGGPMDAPVNGAYGLYYSSDSNRLMRFDAPDGDFRFLNQTLKQLPHLRTEDIAPSTSLRDFLEQHGVSREMQAMGRAGYANTSCGDLDTLSLRQVVQFSRQWETEGEGDGDFKYARTFRCLVDHLKKGIDSLVRLNSAVDTIERNLSTQEVSITLKPTSRQSKPQVIKAKAVVVTASIHVLQTQLSPQPLLRFEPPLPAQYITSLQQTAMHKAMKIFCRFDAQFWPTGAQGMIMAPPSDWASGSSQAFIPETWFNAVGCKRHSGKPHDHCKDCSFYCVGFCTSSFADVLDQFDDDKDICQVVVRQLDRVFRRLTPQHWLDAKDARPLPSASSVFKYGRVQRWTPGRHPYIGGGYAAAVVTVGSPEYVDYARVYGERPLDDLVAFAGEGVNFPAGGTAHAALESGIRAATQIAQILRNRATSPTDDAGSAAAAAGRAVSAASATDASFWSRLFGSASRM